MTDAARIVEHDVLPYVRRPQRYAGHELHRIVKPNAELRFAIAFPDLYEIAMSSLAVQILYHRLNLADPAIAAERVFLPAEDASARFRTIGLPLTTLETRTPLLDVDIVGVSLSYEMGLPGMLELLDLGGIPIHSSERTQSHPIVIAGGPVAYNPEPFADFVDLVAVGDGEELAPEISRTALAAKRHGESREEIIAKLARIDGMYRPSEYQPQEVASGRLVVRGGLSDDGLAVRGRIIESLSPDFYPETPLVPLTEVTFDRISLEIMRGCTRGCRFCQAGTLYRPVRERAVADIVAQARANIDSTGHDELSLTSLSTSDFSPLPELIDALQEEFRGEGISLAFPSLRPDSFTPEMARAFPGSRKAGITFAPEAGSQRLRDVINKNSSEEDLLRAAKLAFEEGYNSVKLYFMIGLPTETDEDLYAIAALADKVAKLRTSKRQRVTVSVSPFAPKPHTPFQRFGQDSTAELSRKLELLRQAFRGSGAKFTGHNPQSALYETTIARGDRRMGGVIERVWRSGGVLEAWNDRFDPARWEQAFRDEGLDPAELAGAIPNGERLPWQHISKGVTERFHEREWKKAVRERVTTDCREGKCHACGLERLIPDDAKVCNSYTRLARPTPQPGEVTEPPGDMIVVARVRYARGEELRWSGHLAFVNMWERLLRRADLPITWTQGFHPHPKLGFGPPLPVGLTSDAEYLDIYLAKPIRAQDLIERINSRAPAGLQALDAVISPTRPAALTAAASRLVYRFDTNGMKNIDEKMQYFLDQPAVMVKRKSKGRFKQVDVRKFVEDIQRDSDTYLLTLRTINGSTVRFDELAELWSVDLSFLTHIRRVKMLVEHQDRHISPLDVLDETLTRTEEAAA